MRFTVDSNILIYALDRENIEKRSISHDIIVRGQLLAMSLTVQAIGEFLSVIRRKQPSQFERAMDLAADWALLFPTAPTLPDHLLNGARLAVRRKIQFWDSVMLEVARDDRVEIFLTEDLQDGAEYDGVRVLNPFVPVNRPLLDRLLEY